MKNNNEYPASFSLPALVIAAIPAYLFPALMSFASGFFLQNTALMAASYRTIGLSSLCSTVLSFILLWQLESRKILVEKRVIRSLLIILFMMLLGMCCTTIFKIPEERFNIIFSAFLGAAILTFRTHQSHKNQK